jgi:hypothetical protein
MKLENRDPSGTKEKALEFQALFLFPNFRDIQLTLNH